jgi:uncharacterized membrane protein (DUF2068 family)
MKRPIGITVLAILQVVSGAAFLLVAATLLLGNQSDVSRQALTMAHLAAGRDTLLTIGVFAVILGGLQLAVAAGLWQLKVWAWGLAALASGASVVSGALNVINGENLPQEQQVSLVVSLLILLYLLTPGVREAFFTKVAAHA